MTKGKCMKKTMAKGSKKGVVKTAKAVKKGAKK